MRAEPRTAASMACIVAALIGLAPSRSASAGLDIRGSWRPETYTLKDGTTHPVTGLIFFTAKDWTVLFFVTSGNRAVERGSGEGGTYTLQGHELVFTHLYNLSAGKAVAGIRESSLQMSVKEPSAASTEPCRVAIDGDRMTIQFPSGNAMAFQRSSGF